MSQEKVDLHKQQKHDRKKLVKKRKIEQVSLVIAGVLVAAALITWIGFSVHSKYEANKAANPVYHDIDVSAMTDYLYELEE